MTITKEAREIEKHVKTLASTKDEQIAIISKAQSMTLDNEYHLYVLTLAKKRIINS